MTPDEFTAPTNASDDAPRPRDWKRPLRRALLLLASGGAIDWWAGTSGHLWIGVVGIALWMLGILHMTEVLAIVSDRVRAPFRKRFEEAYARNEREAAAREERYAREAREREEAAAKAADAARREPDA